MAKINVLIDKQNGQFLTDKQNRQLIFKGINSSNYSKNGSFYPDNSEFNPWEKREDIEKQVNEYGFSVIRYLIFWKGLMPNPDGKINQDYLKRIRERLDIYKDLGVKVILDMHQDIWSSKCGYNGAPDWATIGEYTPQPEELFGLGALTSCYRESFDAFWTNKDGIQDKFVETWQAVAKAFKDHEAVIGYDLFNEPGKTDANIDIVLSYLYFQPRYLGFSLNYFVGGSLVKAVELINTTCREYKIAPFLRSVMKAAIIGALNTIRNVANLFGVNNTEPIQVENLVDVVLDGDFEWGCEIPNYLKQFEETNLTSFYQKAINKIREVDAESIIFVEPTSASVNSGSKTFLGNLVDPRPGLPKLGYIPHAYPFALEEGVTLTYSTDELKSYLDHWFEEQQAYASRQKMIFLVGEFGNFDPSIENEQKQTFFDLFNQKADLYKAGYIFWVSDFLREAPKNPQTNLLATVYPRAVAGRIESYYFDRVNRMLTLKYTTHEGITGKTEIVVPKPLWSDNIRVTADYMEGFSYELVPTSPLKSGLIYLSDIVRDGLQCVCIRL